MLSFPQRLVWIVVFGVLVCLTRAVRAEALLPAMERVTDGVRYGHVHAAEPRPLDVHVLEVDLASPGVSIEAFVPPDPDGAGPAEAMLVDPRECAGQPGVVAAINANAFGALPDPSGKAAAGWREAQPVTIAGWALAGTGERSPAQNGYDQFWVESAGRAHVGRAAEPVEGEARVAVAGFGVLVVGGSIVVEQDTVLHPRSAVGTDAEGRRVWMVVVDGRQPGYSEGMTSHELATLMRQLGCTAALNLDGGGSTVLLKARGEGDGKVALKIMNRPSDGRPRPVPVMLGVTRRR
ncbi:MAG: phosphodiester glycosidase family protein [Planctomycetia bacterium]